MREPEFDKFADNYDAVLKQSIPELINEDAYFAAYKVELMADRLRQRNVASVLDFGCGAGRSLPLIASHFPDARVWGFDVSSESLRAAAERLPQACLFSDWARVAGQAFDAVIVANVLHHIEPTQRVAALRQCREHLSDAGSLFIFEHNPYNPVTRRIFEKCPFDVDAEMLSMTQAVAAGSEAGLRVVKKGYTLFFPKPLAKLRPAERALRWLPLGAQFYVQMAR